MFDPVWVDAAAIDPGAGWERRPGCQPVPRQATFAQKLLGDDDSPILEGHVPF